VREYERRGEERRLEDNGQKKKRRLREADG
jgi:hypothetical protein